MLATRLLASPDLYAHKAQEPEQSVNFVTCHDGFTLNDLVSYNDKHNEANGEQNRDGANDNGSWNCGVEGPTSDPEIERLHSPGQESPGPQPIGHRRTDALAGTKSVGRSRATTTPTARTMRSVGSIGIWLRNTRDYGTS